MVLSTLIGRTQQVNTLYFMENVPVRNSLNPAFQPLSNFYLGFPILGSTSLNFSNNSFILNDLIYKDVNGNPITFLHPNGNKALFINALKNPFSTNLDAKINILDFGFRTGKSYWSLSIAERFSIRTGVPTDLFKFALIGMPDVDQNSFDFTPLSFDAVLFTEAGLGYSRKFNEKWSLGGKVKLLLGTSNVAFRNDDFKLNAGIEEWTVKANGSLNYSSPINLNGNSITTFSPTFPATLSNYLQPSGMGAGIDLGVAFSPMKNLNLSASINDLGFISWNKNLKSYGYAIDFKYTGVDSLGVNSTTDVSYYVSNFLDDLQNSFKDSISTRTQSYRTYLAPKLNVGVEYGFFNNNLSLGILSRTILESNRLNQELTASINGKPVNWFNMSLSYSVFNGRMSNIGAGIGLRTGFLHWFVSADYIPMNYTPLPLEKIDPSFPVFSALIPNKTQGMNFSLGVNLVLGNKKDSDRDGIKDSKDICPNTPKGVKVDKKGCPVDTDGDGVPDYKDKCPKTPVEARKTVDVNGCPLDSDKDGVPDYLDKCPDTPENAIKYVDANGCVPDSDHDGVIDALDKCSDTPQNAKVDSVGCEFDSDGDGVGDSGDKCPDTPVAAIGKVDKNGCPLDTDGDSVPDYLDKCPDVKGSVNNNGCEEIVEKLIEKPIVKPIEKPVVKEEPKEVLKSLFQKALQGIQFESGSDHIMPYSYKILNQIAGVLIANPTYLVEIRGFTDNVGDSKLNQILSEKRARAVMNYLAAKGVKLSRMTANGYGDTMPVADNKTASGRSLNRRVEFIVSYEEITFE